MLGLFYLTNEVGIFWDQEQSQPGNKNVYVLGSGCNNDFSSIVLVNIFQGPPVIIPSDVCVALIDSKKRFQLGHHCIVKVYLLATALHHKNMAPIGTILAICNWHIISTIGIILASYKLNLLSIYKNLPSLFKFYLNFTLPRVPCTIGIM